MVLPYIYHKFIYIARTICKNIITLWITFNLFFIVALLFYLLRALQKEEGSNSLTFSRYRDLIGMTIGRVKVN